MFDECLPKLDFRPGFVKKFIDDIISTAPEDKVDEAKETFNKFDPRGRLEFTTEIEKDKKINFLDMTLIHMNNQNIKTNWYAKGTKSNRIVNYLSAHPKKMKENIAVELVNRVMRLSDPIFKPMNEKRIKEILMKNNYPQRIITKAFESYKNRENLKRQQEPRQLISQKNPENDPIYRSMPFVPHLTQAVNKQMKLANPNLIIAPKHIKKLEDNFTKAKTKIRKEDRTNAIYRIDCKTKLCPEPFYIGETERTPNKRMAEHDRDYKNRFKPGNKTALIKHALDFPGHEPNLETKNVKILEREENKFKRKIIESCYINIYDTTANNYKRDAKRMHENYSNIINIYKNLHT